MNDEDGEELAKALGEAGRFFKCNVLDTESVAAAVEGAASWAKETGKPLGGVIPAAGVSTPATVSRSCRGLRPNYTDAGSGPRSQRFTLCPR